MDKIPPTLPFHLAKAYGVQKPAGVRGVPKPQGAVTVTPVGPGSFQGVRPTDSVDLKAVDKAATIKERLIAAVVPGGVQFNESGNTPTPATVKPNATIPFYRHPADKNAAATGVSLGSRLDTEG